MASQQTEQILAWIRADAMRMQALQCAQALDLPDWCLAAGFVRNLVWDKLHGIDRPTALNDIDLVYFDAEHTDASHDRRFEQRLNALAQMPWSVKNQARMHQKTGNRPYRSTVDAISHWVEVETAVGVQMAADGSLSLLAPLGVSSLLAGQVTLNRRWPQPEVFRQRIETKGWRERWPQLRVME